ncbi:SDR family oxidoreductase [Pantoea sp. GL120224-02]|uniref:SDR family oxidoreductase n=1 Tax=Pantoea sp. GL120224-02 TaxID=1378084 RepID=UPI000BD85E82|nr:SDR family oxidoreductase [Pantoea sp. GL120224-02]SNY79273.1 Short-chain dehydrogenase [Pantoea sp. GL120224-02]
MQLRDKNILLTGASGGIGQPLARLLAQKGARVWLVGRHQAELETLRRSMLHPERHTLFPVSQYTDEEILALADNFHAAQRLDVLINNAGNSRFALLEQQTFDDIRTQLRANIEIPLLLSRACVHQFSARGIILNVGSILGDLGHPGYSVYCATKSALRRFSEALNRELSNTSLSVFYVAPRATHTRLNSPAVNAMNKALGNSQDEPETVAQQIVSVLEREKRRHYIGRAERFFIMINALLPGRVDNALRKKMPVISRFLHSETHSGDQ